MAASTLIRFLNVSKILGTIYRSECYWDKICGEGFSRPIYQLKLLNLLI